MLSIDNSINVIKRHYMSMEHGLVVKSPDLKTLG